MKHSGCKPDLSIMHMLVNSYIKGEYSKRVEKVCGDFQNVDFNLGITQYTFVINAYLKIGDYTMGIKNLKKMKLLVLFVNHMNIFDHKRITRKVFNS